MIQKDCFTSAWIDIVSKQLKYNDKNLIEKVIRALSLLEMLVEAKCPMVFKGGTSLMLILNDTANRLSIEYVTKTDFRYVCREVCVPDLVHLPAVF